MIHLNSKFLRLKEKISEDKLAEKAGLSRLTVRHVEGWTGNPTVESLQQLAQALKQELYLFFAPQDHPLQADVSTVAVSLKVKQDGFDSWPLHFMELVDEFRKTQDLRLLLLPPARGLEPKLVALLASIVSFLCEEVEIPPPSWASQRYFLPQPWFVAETESLKAMAIRDSALAFRKNNIFVQDNFLARA